MANLNPTTPNQPIPPKDSWSNGLIQGLKKSEFIRKTAVRQLTRDVEVLHRSSKSQSLFSSSSEDQTPTASTSNNNSQYLSSPVLATPPISPHQFQYPYPYSPAISSPPPLRHAEIDRFEGPPQQLPSVTQTRRDGPLPVCFAVDVSGSTRGRVLQEEQTAIHDLGSALTLGTQFSRDETWILPWDDRAQSRRPFNGAMSLISGAGTRPSVIINDPVHKHTLQSAGLWCLMTDGYIDEREVQTFANAIPKAGIHGTACVIITFGYYQRSPFECNVSVGMSVFAVAPHCLFLYHAIQDSKVYVFQAKGCFEKLLPEDKRFINFDTSTQWGDLHRISYGELAQLQVPRPIKLSEDSVMLPSGKSFDMRSIYHNKVSKQDQLELLADYASLDVVLLAAKTRGKSGLVKGWLEKARKSNEIKSSGTLEREDFGGAGLLQLRTLITLITNPDDPDGFWDTLRSGAMIKNPQLRSLKRDLRRQHQVNWDKFSDKVRVETELSVKMEETFADVLTTMSHYEEAASLSTPAALTPMSSPVPVAPSFNDVELADAHSHQYAPPPPMSPNMPRMSPLSPMVSPPLQPPSNPGYANPTSHFNPTLPSAPTISHSVLPSINTMIFLPNFTVPAPPGSNQYLPQNYNTCILCGREASLQTLLIQSNSTTEATQNLPVPNARSGHRYPLLLGSYEETDVVLPIVCCDACAFLFVRAGELPNGGGRVTAALPLVPLHLTANRKKWVEILSAAYDHRFSDKIILLVFLSTLCSTIEDIAESQDDGVQTVRACIEWCCKEISRLPGVSTLAGLTPVGSPLTGMVDERMPMQDTIRLAFSMVDIKPKTAESPLLAYPIHGFVALVRLASLFDSIDASEIELFVWKKLCHFFVEQHCEMQIQIGIRDANAKLNTFLFDNSAHDTILLSDGRVARSVCLISDLVNTHLLSQDALYQFRRMGGFFGVMESEGNRFNNALAVFLHIFNEGLKNETRVSDASEFFIQLRYRLEKLTLRNQSLNNILEDPKTINDDMAALSIDLCYRLDEVDSSSIDV